MNWKFWRRGLSPARMEEICTAVEYYLREKGGIVYGSAPSKGKPSGSMTWRFPLLAGVSKKELKMFADGITPAMEGRLIKAQQPTIDARRAKRVANVAAIGQTTT